MGTIGAGLVGSTAAYAMALAGSASEIVLTELRPSLSGDEHEALRESASRLKEAAGELGF